MKTKLRFLFVVLTMLWWGANFAWGVETYTVSNINTSTTYQATEHVQLYIGSGWNIESEKITGNSKAQNGNGEYTSTNYLLPTSGAYLILTPSQNGSMELQGSKNSGGNKYMVIQTSNTNFINNATVTCGGNTCSWNSSRNGYNVEEASGDIVATFNVEAGTTYYVLFDSFSDWSFTGFTFTKQKIDVSGADFGFMYISRNTHSGEAYEGNPLINRLNLPVTYSSTNTSAATIDPSTGAITIQTVSSGIQSTKIKASFAGNDDYNAKEVTYDLNVAKALTYTEIPISALRYRPGVNGISGTGLNRSVGGFDLTFGENEGIKCNNTNNFYFRTNGSGAQGSMTIAMDGNSSNSGKYIKKIVFTAWNDPSLSVNSVAKTSGTLTQTGTREWTWTNYYTNVSTVTFTSQGANDEYILISKIKIYTDETPTFTKVTPVPSFNRNSDSFSTGATVNISDLDINTTPSNFLFDYTYDAGTTTLTHTPYTNNTTWPGTIAGTAVDGTATINASFDVSSNPFYNTVASTNVYTLTVSSAAKNTFTWDFTKSLSEVDSKLLNASTDTWQLNDGHWKLTGGDLTGAFTQDGKELEYVYGLQAYISKGDNTMIYGNSSGFRLNSGSSRYLRIPNLKAGDKVTVLCNNYNNDNRGLNLPSNINDGTAMGWGNQSQGDFTCVGYVKADGYVDLVASGALTIKKIIVESANKPWPTLSFANGSTVHVELPVSGYLDYTNALASVPTGATATYTVLLGNASLQSGATIRINDVVTSDNPVIVRATVSEGTYNSAYYCDYILTASRSDGTARWTYTADSKEIDGEDRPYQGTVTFTSSGTLAGGTRISDVPGITLTIGASGEEWNVVNEASIGLSAYNANSASERPNNITTGCFYTFTPSVNGYLNINVNASGWSYIYENGTEISKNSDKVGAWGEVKLIAGRTYVFCKQNNGAYLHGFTFRPAFLTPDESAEQTATFEAYSSTTNYPRLVHSADAGVRFSGNRSVVNLSNDGGVELVGGGTAIVRGKVMSGDNSLTAYYTLDANVLTLLGTNPTSGSTITSLDNSVFQFLFNQNITIGNSSSFQVLKDATDITSNCTIALNTNTGETDYQKRLNVSGFGTLEAGSTYTIRLLSGAVTQIDNSTITNGQIIGTFTIESTEPPLTWLYPLTTSAVRIGTSIVLLTDVKIDEHYPTDGVIGILTYEGQTEGETITMTAIKDSERLIFKPTSPLEPNKTYTLTVGANQVKQANSTNMITKDKVFIFTTGTATGAEPLMTSATPLLDNSTTSMTYTGGTIEFFFNQNIELEPYSKVTVTPVNGANSTASGESDRLNNSGILQAQSLHVENNRVYFTYSEDELKYDLYYEIEFPVNTVTGTGGMPNSETKIIKFKMQPRPSSLVSGTKDFDGYPHTWNFTNIGTKDVESATNTLTALATYSTDANKATSGWYTKEGFYGNYNYNNSSIKFPQGDVLSYNNGSSNMEIKEASGLRWSLTKNTGSSVADRIRIVPGTKTSLNVVGNTHYLTIPNVPVSKLYIKAKHSDMLNINSPNAVFVQGGMSSNNTKGATTSNSTVYILNVTEAGDVSFCLDDVTFEMIAVATEEKAISSVGYATNARDFSVDYTLDEALLGTGVTAYKITEVSGGSVVASPVTKVPATTAPNQYNGVMLRGNEGSWPLFTLDVNSTEETLTDNKLIGVVSGDDTGELDQTTDSYYNYVLSNGGYTVKYETGETTGRVVGEASGVGFYLLLKDGTRLANNTTYSKESPNDYTAYLQLDEQYVMHTEVGVSSARQFFSIDFGDETTDIKVIGSESSTKTSDGAYYSLQGVRLDNPGKGIYIRNGKMVVVK